MIAPEASGKKSRREHAREVARQEREADERRKKRNRFFVQGGVIVGALAIAAVVALVLTQAAAPPGAGPQNMASDGILFTGVAGEATPVETSAIKAGGAPTGTDLAPYADTVNIVTYIDYACPACKAFESTNAEQIEGWVADGQATLEVHPIAILDRMSLGTKYSSRAANAAACVANHAPAAYLDVTAALFAGQPEEGTSGLDDGALSELVAGAGADDEKIALCISDNSFSDWVSATTDRSGEGPLANSDVESVSSTPTVLVNGVQYMGSITDSDEFARFVDTVEAAG